MTEGRTAARVRLLALFVVVMFVALSTRLWFLQVLATEQYRSQASRNSVRLVETVAPRGRILDANGEVLVGNRMSRIILINRQRLGSDEPAVLGRLSDMLHTPVWRLRQALDNPQYYPFTPVPVAYDVKLPVQLYIGDYQELFPGVSVTKLPVRTYPFGDVAAHVLGYTGQISSEQLKSPSFAGYGQNDLVGKDGVELAYEKYLQGTKGIRKYRVDATGRNLGPIGTVQPPVDGDTLHLTLDEGVQELTEESLALGMEHARGYSEPGSGLLKASAGAVVVMRPDDGSIVAMASSPTYDPRKFVGGIPPRLYAQMQRAVSNYPLVDRAIQGLYAPGSTYKPFVAAAAMHAGIANTSDYYSCPAEYTAPGDTSGQVFHNWTTHDLPPMTLAGALIDSCDTVFYKFGWDYYQRRPSEPLQRDLRSFGFNRPTLVDLPNEQPGVVPDLEWLHRTHRQNPNAFPRDVWYPGDDIQMTIGQGATLVTPLQIATAYSAIANGGRICVPHVAGKITAPGGKPVKRIEPPCRGKVPFSSAQLGYIRDALTEVPRSGTAAPAFNGFPSDIWIAGKTGTAEVVGQQDNSWFAAMAGRSPNRPDYVVVALVEQGGHGATTAAPIVRRVVEGLYGETLSNASPGAPSD
jgi:penicillin-binding protein 2